MNSETSSLNFWQEKFRHSLLNDLDENLKKTFNQTSSEKRFAIYQNNVFHSLCTALGELYPVVKKLVGDEFFTGTASYYIRKNPPQQAAMVHLGKDFPQFLREFEHTQKIAYLSDIAELELAWHQAYHAEDFSPLTSEVFSAINAENLSEITVTFHPSATLVCSQFPIFSIWQDNQDENKSEQEINLNEPQQVFVVRPSYDVLLFAIDNSMALFIDKLKSNKSIGNAIESTLEQYSDFNISQAIQFLIQEQLLTQLSEKI